MEQRVERDSAVRLLVALANIVLGLILLVALVWAGLRISHVLLIFALAALLAYALHPLVARLRAVTRGRLSQGGGVFLVLIAFVGLTALLIAAAAGPTTQQVRQLEAEAPALRARADALAAGVDQWLAGHHIALDVASTAQQLSRLVHERSQSVAREVLHAAGRLAAGLIDLMLVLLVSVYFLIYSQDLTQRLSKNVPPRYQQHFHGLRRDLNRILGGFIRGQLLIAATMGVAAAVGCALLRLPFWILLGLFVSLCSLIPVIGAYLGAIPAVSLALLDPVIPVAKLIWVVVLFFVVNEAGSKILYPRLVGSATGLHEVAVLFVLLAGAEVGGVLGALLAVPLTALAGLVATYAYRTWRQAQHPAEPEPSPPVVSAVEEKPTGRTPAATAESIAAPGHR